MEESTVSARRDGVVGYRISFTNNRLQTPRRSSVRARVALECCAFFFRSSWDGDDKNRRRPKDIPINFLNEKGRRGSSEHVAGAVCPSRDGCARTGYPPTLPLLVGGTKRYFLLMISQRVVFVIAGRVGTDVDASPSLSSRRTRAE